MRNLLAENRNGDHMWAKRAKTNRLEHINASLYSDLQWMNLNLKRNYKIRIYILVCIGFFFILYSQMSCCV